MTQPCRQFRKSISLLASGDLDPAQAGALHTHLLNCAACARYRAVQTTIVAEHHAVAASLAGLQVNPGFHARLRHHILQGAPDCPAERSSIRLLRWCGAGAVTASIVLGALFWPREQAPPARNPSGNKMPAIQRTEPSHVREPTLAKYSGSLHTSVEQFEAFLAEDAGRGLAPADTIDRIGSAYLD